MVSGSRKFPGERIGYPRQYSCASLGGSGSKESICNAGDLGSILGWEDPLEKGVATHSSILSWRIPWTEEPGRAHKESDTTERLLHRHTTTYSIIGY